MEIKSRNRTLLKNGRINILANNDGWEIYRIGNRIGRIGKISSWEQGWDCVVVIYKGEKIYNFYSVSIDIILYKLNRGFLKYLNI